MNLEDKKDNQEVSTSSSEAKQETAVAQKSPVSSETNGARRPFRSQDRKINKDRPQRPRQDFRKPKEQSDFQEKVI